MRILLVILMMVGLHGCSTFDPPPVSFVRKQATVEIIENANFKDPNVQGMTICINDKCTILLRDYPKCLNHEMRHVFEGDWHKGYNTTNWCYNDH